MNYAEYERQGMPTFMEREFLVKVCGEEDSKLHLAWPFGPEMVLVNEYIPENYPQASFAVWANKKEYLNSIYESYWVWDALLENPQCFRQSLFENVKLFSIDLGKPKNHLLDYIVNKFKALGIETDFYEEGLDYKINLKTGLVEIVGLSYIKNSISASVSYEDSITHSFSKDELDIVKIKETLEKEILAAHQLTMSVDEVTINTEPSSCHKLDCVGIHESGNRFNLFLPIWALDDYISL